MARSYTLVSACRNESAYVPGLVASIAAQQLKPSVWIIVDDGSTDDTYAVAAAAARRVPFVSVVRMVGGGERSFVSQVFAARYGYEQLRELKFDFIGFLDADIRVEPDYYARLVGCLDGDPSVGLAGGMVVDTVAGRQNYIRRGSEKSHVPGGVQFFRRECFESIGGYVAVPGGGQDTIADIMTLMAGWKVQVFTQLRALHLRPTGALAGGGLRRGVAAGRKCYSLGYHPLFFVAFAARRFWLGPLSTIAAVLNFIFLSCLRSPRPVTEDFVRFQRDLQHRRLTRTVRRLVPSAAWRRAAKLKQTPGPDVRA